MEKQTSKKLRGAAAKGAGPGRPKGVPNKNTGLIREMVAQALDQAGGVEYLSRQAEEKPAAFLALVGKMLPIQLAGDPTAPVKISFTWEQ